MKIYVASLRQPTASSELSEDRKDGDSIQEYAKKEISRRIVQLSTHIRKVADHINNSEKKHTIFFTVPEFYWNVKWGALRNEEELLQLTDYMMTHLSDALEHLMKELPESNYGPVVLLAGSLGVLIQLPDLNYEAINYCLIANNFKKNGDGRYEMSMWPKRNTSHIDFGERITRRVDAHQVKLGDNVTVWVMRKNQTVAEHNTAEGYGDKLANNLVPGCPFSINLCLDYDLIKTPDRDSEVYEPQSCIDFLLSCGMGFSPEHVYPASVQFAIRNDGMDVGQIQYLPVQSGIIDLSSFPQSPPPNVEIASLASQVISDKVYLIDLDIPRARQAIHSRNVREIETELERTKQELIDVKMERDLLQKCTAYFAKQSQ